jgi:hypothetical protein
MINNIGALLLFLIPGYLSAAQIPFKEKSFIRNIYLGFCISVSTSIFIGSIFSRLDIFKGYCVFIYFIVFLLLSAALYIYRKKKVQGLQPKNRIIYKDIFITASVFIILILIFYLCYVFENYSDFPVGWDRGHHFGRMLYLINNNQLPLFEPGTLYNPFYFQGFNITISSFTLLTSPFSELSIAGLSNSFTFFTAIMIAFYPIVIYSITLHLCTNNKVALLASISFLPIAGREFISSGPLGENLGIILLGGVIIIGIELIKHRNTNNYINQILFFVFIGAIALIHVIAITFAILTLILLSLWSLIKKEVNAKECTFFYLQIVISILITAVFLYFTNPNLAHGIIDEVVRKSAEPGPGWLSASLGLYLSDSLNLTLRNLEDAISLLLTPLFVIGVIVYIRRNKGYLIPIFLSSLILIIIPILPFNRPSFLLVYPMTMFSGFGLCYLFIYAKKTEIYRYLLVILAIFSIITVGILDSLDRANYWGEKRTEYWPQDEYNQSFHLIEWIGQNIDLSSTITCPDSSPLGYLITASIDNTVLFADPKWLDVPLYQEIALIYDIKTPKIVREQIIEKYQISTIIVTVYTEKYLEIIETIKNEYPSSSIYKPTSLHTVIILHEV